MKRLLFSLTGLAAVVLAICSQTFLRAKAAGDPPALPSYRLAWHDEFNGHELDTTSWSYCRRAPVPWAKYMTADPRLYEVRKGRLRLYGRVNNGLLPRDTARYLTGGVCSEHKRTIRYGKIEVRARIQSAVGCWPAIWTSSDPKPRRQYPYRAEVDLVEHYNDEAEVRYTVHSNYTDILKKTKQPVAQTRAALRRHKWNVYTLEILPDCLIYSVNGNKVHVYPRVEADSAEWQYPFGKDPCYVLLSMQIGNKWLRTVHSADFPVWMDIDYVRLYELE